MRRLGMAGSFLLCIGLLLAMGYGVSQIYETFFRTLDDGFYRLEIQKKQSFSVEWQGTPLPASEPPAVPPDTLRQIDAWAKEENALLLLMSGTSQVLFSNTARGREKLQMHSWNNAEGEVYVSEALLSDTFYVRDGLLFPDRNKVKIAGSVNFSYIPRIFTDDTFCWLISLDQFAGGLSGDFFVLLTDSEHYEVPRSLLEEAGLHVAYSYVEQTSLADFFSMFRKNLYAYSSFFLIFLSLGIAVVLIHVSWWRGQRERIRIQHLCGKSNRKTCGSVLLTCFAVWGTACIIWFFLFPRLRFYYSAKAIREVLAASCAVLLVPVIAACILSILVLFRNGKELGR